MIVHMQLNAERRGIELVFEEKPSPEVREVLKERKWRWNPKRCVWYAPDSPEARTFADSVVAGTAFEALP